MVDKTVVDKTVVDKTVVDKTVIDKTVIDNISRPIKTVMKKKTEPEGSVSVLVLFMPIQCRPTIFTLPGAANHPRPLLLKRIALLQIAAGETSFEPGHTLFRRAVSE